MKKNFKLLITFFIFIAIGCTHEKVQTDYEYETKDVEIVHEDFLLDGEILLPISKTKVPAVVIIPGSGPSDMDGNVGKQKPYKDIAKGLAKKGIASIRFNKITYQYVKEVAKDVNFTIEDEYINDVLYAILLLKGESKIDSKEIYLIGHSMGSQIVPIIIKRDPEIKGSIIMAGTTMHILNLLLDHKMTNIHL